jgi:hypothetical protein
MRLARFTALATLALALLAAPLATVAQQAGRGNAPAGQTAGSGRERETGFAPPRFAGKIPFKKMLAQCASSS